MGNRRVAVVVVVLLLLGGALWWWRHQAASDRPATSTVTQSTGSAVEAQSSHAKPAAKGVANLTITVSDAAGPIPGAIVRLAPEDGEVILARTGSDGVASAKVAAGDCEISASASEHQPAALPKQELTAGRDVKLTITLLVGGRSLSGVVTDVSGGPIAGARIDAAKLGAMARPDAAVSTAVTGNDGRYHMTVPEGQLLVAARSADYSPQSRYVEVGGSGATADFALVPGGVIEGVVVDERSKEPVALAIVEARRDSAAIMMAEAGGHHVIAGPDGHFRISGLRPGVYELDARQDRRRSKSATVIGLGVAEQVGDVQLLIGVGAVIRGKVVDDNAAPVAGATVGSIGRGGDAEAKTDASGAFVLEGLNAGQYFLFARNETVVPAGGTPVDLADKDLDNVIVRVRRGMKLKGHVEPRQVAEVRLEPSDRELAMPTFVAPITTKADGEFELGPIAPGNAMLSARCPSGDQGSVAIELAPSMADVVLKVTPGGSIAGRVLDGDSKPVAGMSVMASAQGPSQRTMIVNGMVTSGVQGVTGANGSYELRGLAAGNYGLSVLDRGRPLRMRGKPVQVKLANADKKTGVDLSVDRPNGVIKGVVTGPDGKPLADAWVSVRQDLESMIEGAMGRPGGPGGGPGGSGSSGPGGAGGGPGSGGTGGPGGDGEGESRFVTVESRDEGGGAAAGAIPPALTDAQGRFEIIGLPHSSYEVLAEAQAGKLRGRSTAVTPDATIAIQVLGVTSLSGTVRGANGPSALFTVELAGPTRAQRTFTDGTFSLGRVDAGSYVVRVTSRDGNAETKVVVVPNKPTTVDIVLVANAIVVGTLVDVAGKPVAGVPITIIDDRGDGRMQISIEGVPPMSGPDGKFRIEHKAGLGMLVVLTPPRPVTKKGLALEAGKMLDVGQVQVGAGEPPPNP